MKKAREGLDNTCIEIYEKLFKKLLTLFTPEK